MVTKQLNTVCNKLDQYSYNLYAFYKLTKIDDQAAVGINRLSCEYNVIDIIDDRYNTIPSTLKHCNILG